MNLCLPNVRHRLAGAGCLKTGTILDEKTIELCLAAVDANLFVLPRIVEEKGKLKLNFEIRQRKQADENHPKPISVDVEDLVAIPGIIARGVLDHLGADLTDSEIQRLSTPQVTSAADISLLGYFASTFDFGTGNRMLVAFLKRNSNCIAGWMLYVFEGKPADKVTKRFAGVSSRLNCDRLDIAALVRQRASQETLLKLLELAPQYQGDTYYHAAMALVAQRVSDPKVTNHLLEVWREMEPGYPGCVSRAQILINLAWRARGGNWGNEVSDEGFSLFEERLDDALIDLETATDLNPSGWQAHSKLITVAKGLGLPKEYAEQHFRKAIASRPRFYDAYLQMYTFMQPRWHGSPEEFLKFGRECIETGFWENGIPQLGRSAIEELCTVPADGATIRTSFRDPQLWDAVKLYYESAQMSGLPEYKTFSLNLFAKFGAYGGHFEDVADTYQILELEGIDTRAFWDGFTYQFLRDLVFSYTAAGQIRDAASLQTSLNIGNLLAAERLVRNFESTSEDEKKVLDRSQRIINIGKKLLDEKSIELSATQIHDLFDGIGEYWHVEKDELVCRLPPESSSLILFPFGIADVEIAGTISWSERPQFVIVHSHTRALRDNVSIEYAPRNNKMNLFRGTNRINSDRLNQLETSFRMILSSDEDRFEPTPGIHWSVPVYEPFPSGFGFQVTTDKARAIVSLKNLRIKMLK